MPRIRRLALTDDCSQFSSGSPHLDRFFQGFAGQNQFRHHIGVTYVAIAAEVILGFITVTPAEIAIDALPDERRRQLPRYPLPVLRVARLAVAEHAKGRGIGKALLGFALNLARKTAVEVGCTGVVVDAKPQALAFYLKYGFEPFALREGGLLERPEPTTLFLPLSAIPPSSIK